MINLSTTIEKVSIYRNGAEVLRKGRAELEAGTQTLHVYGLTATATADTARLFANGGLSCSNMRIYTPQDDEDEESEYRSLQEEIALIDKKIETKRLQIKLWKDNGDFSSREQMPAEEMQEYIEKLGDRVLSLEKQITELGKERRRLEKKSEEVMNQQQRQIMSVEVTAERAGTYDFELRYYETGANWVPVYEIHSDAENPVEIKFRGRIYQYTSEDWNDVALSLFTGDPSRTGVLPKLNPVYLDIREPVHAERGAGNSAFMGAGMAAPMMGAKMAMATADTAVMEEAAMAPMARMTMKQAQVNKDETMTEYSLPGTRSIPRNADGIMADLQNFEIPAEYRICTVPSADLSAYLTARIKASDIPFTSAVSAGIYLKGMYTEEISIDPDLTQEYVNITLGREERVKISRKELARKTSTTLLKGQKVVEYSFETRAANLSDSALKLHIEDQMPVSQNKEITVDPVELSDGKHNAETGIIEWDITLAPAEAKTLKLGYKVSRPKDKEIRERREGGVKICPMCGTRTTARFCPNCGSML